MGRARRPGLDDWRVTTRDPCSGTVECDDGDACTTDLCDVGICRSTPLPCDDGNACTTDGCTGGACSNTPLECDDGEACTTDVCTGGSCQHVAATDLALARSRLNALRELIATGPCGGEPLVGRVKKKLRKLLAKADRFIAKAEAAGDPAAVAAKLAKAAPLLPLARTAIDVAVGANKLTEDCGAALESFLDDVQECIAAS